METPSHLSALFLKYIQTANLISASLLPSDWLRLAIRSSAGSGNPKNSILKLSSPAIDKIRNEIVVFHNQLEKEPTADQTSFDNHFLRSAKQLQNAVAVHSPETAFSFGRSQKILNIYLKYEYAESRVRPSGQALAISWRRFFHVPIDRQTLRFFYRDLEYRPLTLKSNRALISWKWALEEQTYLKIQKAARDFTSKGDFEDPLHFEMGKIWTQPFNGRFQTSRTTRC